MISMRRDELLLRALEVVDLLDLLVEQLDLRTSAASLRWPWLSIIEFMQQVAGEREQPATRWSRP